MKQPVPFSCVSQRPDYLCDRSDVHLPQQKKTAATCFICICIASFLFLFPVIFSYVFRRFVAKGVQKHGGEKNNKKHRAH
jgi:hypothetical protein